MEVWGNWQIGKLTNRQINQSTFFFANYFCISIKRITFAV